MVKTDHKHPKYPTSDFSIAPDSTGKLHEKHLLYNGIYAIPPCDRYAPFRYPPHYHGESELVSVPHGCGGSLNVEGRKITFEEGSLLFIEANKIHSFDIRACADEGFLILIVDLRNLVGIADRFEECGDNRLEKLLSIPRVVRGREQARLHQQLLRLSLVMRYYGGDLSGMNPAQLAVRDLAILFNVLEHVISEEPIPSIGADAEPVKRVISFLDNHYGEPLTLDEIAARSGLSRAHLCRTFRRLTGTTVGQCLLHLRIDHAKQMMSSTDANISEIACECGFPDPAYFTKVFRKFAGVAPKRWRAEKQQRHADLMPP